MSNKTFDQVRMNVFFFDSPPKKNSHDHDWIDPINPGPDGAAGVFDDCSVGIL